MKMFMSVVMNAVEIAHVSDMQSEQKEQCGMKRQRDYEDSEQDDTATHTSQAEQKEQCGMKRQRDCEDAEQCGTERLRDCEDTEQADTATHTGTSTSYKTFAAQVKDEFVIPKIYTFKNAFRYVYSDRLQGLEPIGGLHVILNDRPLQLVHTICTEQVASVLPEYVIFHKEVCALLLQVCLKKLKHSQEGDLIRQKIANTIDMWKQECSSLKIPASAENLTGTAALMVREIPATGNRLFATFNSTLVRAGVSRMQNVTKWVGGTITMPQLLVDTRILFQSLFKVANKQPAPISPELYPEFCQDPRPQPESVRAGLSADEQEAFTALMSLSKD